MDFSWLSKSFHTPDWEASLNLRKSLFAVPVCLAIGLGQTAGAAPIFDFGTTTRALVSTTASTPPTAADLSPLPAGAFPLFTVGNLFNGCGLFPSVSREVIKTGTGCEQTNHDITSPIENLSRKIGYTDTFTIGAPTTAVLEFIVKLGHPEAGGSKNQNQDERFDVYLVRGVTSVLLAQLLDDVDSNDGEEDDAYYRYVFDARELPMGTWSPEFRSVAGSVEFLTRLSALPGNQTPLPGTIWLLALALAGIGFVRRRCG